MRNIFSFFSPKLSLENFTTQCLFIETNDQLEKILKQLVKSNADLKRLSLRLNKNFKITSETISVLNKVIYQSNIKTLHFLKCDLSELTVNDFERLINRPASSKFNFFNKNQLQYISFNQCTINDSEKHLIINNILIS